MGKTCSFCSQNSMGFFPNPVNGIFQTSRGKISNMKKEYKRVKDIIANNVLFLMKKHGFTKNLLAVSADIDPHTVINIVEPEKTSNVPTLTPLVKIAKVFDIDFWQLLVPDASTFDHHRTNDMIRTWMALSKESQDVLLTLAKEKLELETLRNKI